MKIIGEAQITLYGPEDEGPHQPENSEWWNESVWLHFLEMSSGIHGILRIGHEPNLNGGQSAIWSLVATPKWIYKRDGFAALRADDRPANGFNAHGTHRFEYDGRCHWTIKDTDFFADLILEDYHPPLSFTPKDSVLKNIARNHTEAAGQLSGTIVIKGEEYRIKDALGYRDHSWGVRNWHNMRSHRWAGTNFGKDFSCNAICFFDETSTLGRFGYVRRGDTIIASTYVDVLAYLEPDGFSHRGGTASYVLANGEKLEIQCSPINKGMISRHHGTALNDTICTAKLGDRIGATCFEMHNNSRAGTLMPVQHGLVRAIVDNGIWPAWISARMFAPDELATLLDAISRLLCGEFRADLRSEFQKKNADLVAITLNRIVSQLRSGETLASGHLQQWRALNADFSALTGGTPLADSGGADSEGADATQLSTLMRIMAGMQSTLADRARYDAFIAALRAAEPKATGWLRASGAAMVDLLEKNEKNFEIPLPSEASPEDTTDPQVLQKNLSGYLRRRYPDLPADAVKNFRVVPGGYVKQTAIFDLPPNSKLPTTVVLRRDLAASITGTSVQDEYPIIQRVHELGLPVPKPLLLENDATILGGRFMLMTVIADSTTAGPPFARERALEPHIRGPGFGREVASLLARLHSGTVSTPPAGESPYEQHMQKLRVQQAAWQAMPKPPLSLAVELGYAFLFSQPALTNRPHCLVHGDFGTHNILVRNGRIAALVDWELAQEGDPAVDIAQCRMVILEDVMPWSEFVSTYVEAGGDPRACAPDAVAHFCIAAMLKHTYQFVLGRNYFFSGARGDALALSIATQWTERVLQYSARAVKIAADLVASGGAELSDPFYKGKGGGANQLELIAGGATATGSS